MLTNSIVVKKEYLTTVQENCTLEEALRILEDSGYRCVPILDETGQIFRGNIYKMHIYRHKSQGGDMSLPVTYLLKNATKTIPIDAPFFRIFFNIKDLPYIAVIDENGHFYGILTHSRLLKALSDAWNVDVGSYVITVLSDGRAGDLALITKIISRFASIASCMTMDATPDFDYHRILFTLDAGVSERTLTAIIQHLESKKFVISEIDDLKTGEVLRHE